MKYSKLFLMIGAMNAMNSAQACEPSTRPSDKVVRCNNILCELAADSPRIDTPDDKNRITHEEMHRKYGNLQSMQHIFSVSELHQALTMQNNAGKRPIDVATEIPHKSEYTHRLINSWTKEERGLGVLIAQGKGNVQLDDIDIEEMKNAIERD